MPRLKVTCYIEVDESFMDRDNPTNLSQHGYEELIGDLRGFDDAEFEEVTDV